MTTHGHGHGHDGIDWAEKLGDLSRHDALATASYQEIARSVVTASTRTVIDVGPGAGGMSLELARQLADHGGGTLVLVDMTPEVLDHSVALVRGQLGGQVEVRPVKADVADPRAFTDIPAGDLVWASHVVHHLPDQQLAVRRLAALLTPGGRLALAEGGLEARTLPWDVGIGAPGLEHRLCATRGEWFRELRDTMPDAVRLPVGWTRALAAAGLVDVTSFTTLVDHPAPASAQVREAVVDRLRWLLEITADRLGADDLEAVHALLDTTSPHFAGARDDIYWLAADTVHLGTAPTG
ncbi:hypothetical protein GCM10012275_11260 [Longimycelium tulufanense]|uniref:Methyltransferase type 12 domain-containing protein n=1 Tax=Longimycelium tulufanense TaxID=907463 RepID=A0A8J3CA18_9PSEU|nr:class I SAM-dependent methyltransferase [Longimycelium tulufanense]GGM42044.1 hypothetical protein GCM10012275_11260 [Longimycelium tulufanense]